MLVFGGSRGIGAAVAARFAREGASVTVVARGAGPGIHCADVGDAQAVAAVFERAGPVQVVVNAAAIQGGAGAIGPLWETDPSAFAEVLRVNLLGSYHVLREALRSMRRHAVGGAVILFSGGGAAFPRPRFAAYGASKTAVVRLVESTARELAEAGSAIRVFAVAPGAVATAMTREIVEHAAQAGVAETASAQHTLEVEAVPPELAAELCLFLAGEDAASLSGRLLHVREPYRDYLRQALGDDAGRLRRIGFAP